MTLSRFTKSLKNASTRRHQLFIEELRSDDPEIAASLRIEEHSPCPGG